MISFTEKSSGSAYNEEYVGINGISQYFLHWPADPEAPVFLHIHGGPGAPASVFAYLTEEPPRNHTIVYYDQRGAGKTLRRNPFARLSMDLLKQDLLETVLYLKKLYGREKIGILGHSWGSVLGGVFALEHPEHVSCCVFCGQMCCFRENEARAYELLREAVLQSGDKKAKRALDRLGKYPAQRCSPKALLSVTRMRSLQGRFGLAMTMDEKARQIFRRSPVTGWGDMLAFALGGLRSAALMGQFWNQDLQDMGYKYKMPVYFVMGDRDRTTPHELAREYFDKLDAPRKGWYSVPDAGHFAMLDNTRAWRDIMGEIAAEA